MKAETLKKAILQYAMQGKLVEQNPNDEPASVLLERIKAEKEQLIKDGKIKKEKPLPPITEDEIPYELPKGWEWARLGNIYNIGSAKRVHQSDWRNKGIPFYRAREIGKLADSGFVNNDLFIEEDLFDKFSKFGAPKPKDIMVTAVGTLGKAYVVKPSDKFYYKDASVICLHNICSINPYFIKYLLSSPIMLEQISDKVAGTTVGTITIDKANSYIIPLPPFAEQERIVEKLEQILPLVDEYGKNEEKLSKLNSTLPDKIKQSILQHAVQGKLVPQNPSDEPASELLKRIKAEKEQLIKDGKIKKEKPLPPITEDEMPFELPDSWEWVKLGDICSKIVDGDHNPPTGYPVKTDYLMLSASNINCNKIVDLDKVRYLKKEVFKEENKRTNLQVDDILFTIVGTLGRSCIYDGNLNICFQRSVSVLTTLVYNKYLKTVLDSPYIQTFMQINATGTAQKGFYLNQVANLLIPVPPLAEQQRIVTKVEELLAVIDNLKKG